MTIYRAITSWGMAAIVVLLIAWDIVLSRLNEDTESQIISELARKWSVLPFFLGVLVGHWLMNRTEVDYSLWPIAVGALLLVVGLDAAHHLSPVGLAAWVRYPGIWAVVGIAVGSFFWGQRLPGGWSR